MKSAKAKKEAQDSKKPREKKPAPPGSDAGDTTLQAYESYVLSDYNIEAGLHQLVKGSAPYNYLYFLDLLKKKGSNLSATELAEFKKYLEDTKSPQSRKLEVIYFV